MAMVRSNRICQATSGAIFFVICFSYYTQNGLWLPQPLLVRQDPEICPDLWWPKEEKRHRSEVNESGIIYANRCAWTRDFDAEEKLRNDIELSNSHRFNSEKDRINPKDYLTLMESVTASENPVSFQPIDTTRGYVVSAFIDRRLDTPDVKVLYIVPFSSPVLYCQAYCDDSYITVQGRPMFLPFYRPAHQNCIWQQYLLHCLFPPECDIETVSVTSAPCMMPTNSLEVIETHAPYKSPTRFAVCLNQIFDMKEKDIPSLVRFIESFLLIGGEKIYLYGLNNVDRKVKSIVASYVKQGVITLYDWKLPPAVTSVFYFAQVLQNTDCLYRHMIDTELLLYLDLDEILISVKYENLLQLFDELKKDSTYGYEAGLHLKRLRVISGPKVVSAPLNSHSNIAGSPRMCLEPQPKSLIRPRKTIQVGVHYMEQPLRPFSFGRYVDETEAAIVHLKYGGKCTGETDVKLQNPELRTMLLKLDIINNRTLAVMKSFQTPQVTHHTVRV